MGKRRDGVPTAPNKKEGLGSKNTKQKGGKRR